MYLFISKSKCLSCEKAREVFVKNNIKFREVNCSNENLSNDDIEIMKNSPKNSLSIYIKKEFIKNKTKISGQEIREIFDNFILYGSFPIIIKFNFIKQIENYMIGFSDKILESWFKNDSLVGQYLDLNFAFKAKTCCHICDRDSFLGKMNNQIKWGANETINRLQNIKKDNNDFLEKYNSINKQEVENVDENDSINKQEVENVDENNLIMAFDIPQYEKNHKKIDFILKRESTSTIEIPLNDKTIQDELELISEDKKLLNKFKLKIKNIGKNRFKKDQEYIIEHLETVEEVSDFGLFEKQKTNIIINPIREMTTESVKDVLISKELIEENTNFINKEEDTNFINKEEDINFINKEEDTNFINKEEDINFINKEEDINFINKEEDINFINKEEDINFINKEEDINFINEEDREDKELYKDYEVEEDGFSILFDSLNKNSEDE